MAVQPMFKHPVKRSYVHSPLLAGHAYCHWMTFNNNEVAARKCRLKKPSHQEVAVRTVGHIFAVDQLLK